MLNHGEARNSLAFSLIMATAFFLLSWVSMSGVSLIIMAALNPMGPIAGWTAIAFAILLLMSFLFSIWLYRIVYLHLRWNPPTLGHCPTCNYNLTGNQSGRCPECGHPCKTASPTPSADRNR